MQLHTDRNITTALASRLAEQARTQAGRRKQRTLSQPDVTRFIELLRKHRKTAKALRVYSGDGFVPNSYQWRADIDCISADRDENDAWKITIHSVSARRPRGQGALSTVDGKAV